ncbi:MAG: lipopolysaccharide kinase InaA family protein [Alcanivorax sp.]
MKTVHVADAWRASLAEQGLSELQDWWHLSTDWVEPPNFRRGGWSGVSRLRVPGPDGAETLLYVKRQAGQRRRTLTSGGRARPTYYQDFLALSTFRDCPRVQWVFFAEDDDRAVLVTRAPDGFVDLGTFAARVEPARLFAGLIAVTAALSALHRRRIQHGACYPEHILIDPETLRVRLLDYERWRYRWSVTAAAHADLDQLLRRAPFLDTRGRDTLLRTARLYAPRLTLTAPPAPQRVFHHA